MFLTKKSFRKILIMVICYFLLGSIFVALWAVFNIMAIEENFLLILGIILYFFCVPIFFLGRYTEGEGKLINLGNKLIRKELKPAEFIKHYEVLKNSDDLVIKKPSFDVLRVALIAYDLLEDREKTLATVDEMIKIASDKKQNLAKILKSALLFSYGEIQEADILFNDIQKQKLNIVCSGLVDIVLKSDRAMAMGDYKTVEAYHLKTLSRSFPKLDKVDLLVSNYQLGKVYEKLQNTDKAIEHYQYCANFGGETAIKIYAVEKLKHINKIDEKVPVK